MAWCLIKSEEIAFRKALVEKKLDPFKLAEMSSSEARRAEFEKYVSPENAKNINALYESKLLLKNQVTGFKNWVKRSAGMKATIKRDLISKIDRLSETGVLGQSELQNFKEDLINTRLNMDISFEEAQTINTLAEARSKAQAPWEAKKKENPTWTEDPHVTRKEWINDESRIQFGLRQVALENYVNALKIESKKIIFREHKTKATLQALGKIPAVFKSMMSTLDNSFWGRQGIKNFYGSISQKKIWGRNFLKSFADIKSDLLNKKIDGFDAMDLIKADIYSRPNATNGKYKAGDYRLNVLGEEAYPISLGERVPFLGRLFKASETSFNGGALRMRADLADLLISKAEKQGVNTLNPAEARGIGHLVGSLTGRGSLGKGEAIASELNVFLFSARFFKSNVDTLTAHQVFDSKSTEFSRSEARKNLASIIVHVGGLLLLAKLLDPDSVDEDPRSTNFGKIKIFGKWIDITGGLRSLIIPIAKVFPTKREGVWGSWSKSSTGNWINLRAGKFGQQNGVDVWMDALFLNKLSPVGAIVRDAIRAEMFGGEPFDIKKSIINSVTPLSIQTYIDLKDEKFGTILGLMAFEFVGLNPSTYKPTDHWSKRTSKEMTNFKSQVGEDLFKQANDDYNRAYNIWFDEVQKDPRYRGLSDDGKAGLRTDAKAALKDKILLEYGYYKEKTIKTDVELDEEYTKEDLTPRK